MGKHVYTLLVAVKIACAFLRNMHDTGTFSKFTPYFKVNRVYVTSVYVVPMFVWVQMCKTDMEKALLLCDSVIKVLGNGLSSVSMNSTSKVTTNWCKILLFLYLKMFLRNVCFCEIWVGLTLILVEFNCERHCL